MDLLFGIDVGTTNWKVAAFDTDGCLHAIHRAPNTVHYTPEGFGYYDAEEIWSTIARLICFVIEDTANIGTVAGVSVTGMAEAVVGIAADGAPVETIIPWFDTRSMAEADFIRTEIGKREPFRSRDLTAIRSSPCQRSSGSRQTSRMYSKKR